MIKAELLNYMGNDLSVVNAARVSFSRDKKVFTMRDAKLIKYLANTYFPKTRIIDVDTVRDANKIALSSRLTRLSKESLSSTCIIYETLHNMKSELLKGATIDNLKEESVEYLESNGIHVEYLDVRSLITLEEATDRLKSCGIFIACYLDDVRLIDNIEI